MSPVVGCEVVVGVGVSSLVVEVWPAVVDGSVPVGVGAIVVVEDEVDVEVSDPSSAVPHAARARTRIRAIPVMVLERGVEFISPLYNALPSIGSRHSAVA
jgi:hypothetical protein